VILFTLRCLDASFFKVREKGQYKVDAHILKRNVGLAFPAVPIAEVPGHSHRGQHLIQPDRRIEMCCVHTSGM
jgi:hypothetical protein